MNGSLKLPVVLIAVVGLLGLAGCPGSSGGPATVPVKGTLTIDGEPANNVTVTFAPLDSSGSTASGPVTNGSFELFSGVEGKPGAVPGKYKVVLAASGGGTDQERAAAYASAGAGGPPAEQELPFPAKYKDAGTSDKEVEVTSGSNDIKIELSGA